MTDVFGIEKENLSQIFDKFYRIRTEKTRKVVGSGLGLPLVKDIVEAHLGTISVESKSEQGTTFTIRFPHIQNNYLLCLLPLYKNKRSLLFNCLINLELEASSQDSSLLDAVDFILVEQDIE